VEVRGFGFKLDGGLAQNRAVYISSLEDGKNLPHTFKKSIYTSFFR
jgi:hypothetical protein